MGGGRMKITKAVTISASRTGDNSRAARIVDQCASALKMSSNAFAR